MNIELDLELFSYLSRRISFMGFLQLLILFFCIQTSRSLLLFMFSSTPLACGCAAAMVAMYNGGSYAMHYCRCTVHRCLRKHNDNLTYAAALTCIGTIMVWIIMKSFIV